MKPIQTILFDCGGVIVKDPTQDIYKYFAESFGVMPDQFAFVAEPHSHAIQSQKLSSAGFWKNVTTELGVPMPQTLQQFLVDELLAIPFRNTFTRIEPTWQWIQQLQNDNASIAMLSNTIPEHVRVLEENGILKPFGDARFLSSELGLRKPQKALYEYVVRSLGVAPQQILFIDDKKDYLEPATALGMHTYHFTSAEKAQKELFTKTYADLFL